MTSICSANSGHSTEAHDAELLKLDSNPDRLFVADMSQLPELESARWYARWARQTAAQNLTNDGLRGVVAVGNSWPNPGLHETEEFPDRWGRVSNDEVDIAFYCRAVREKRLTARRDQRRVSNSPHSRWCV